MSNNVLVKYNGGSNRRSISLGAVIEAKSVAETAVANLKAAASSYTSLVKGGVAGECGSSCVSECLHLTVVNRLVSRIREAQAVVPGALRRLAEIGLESVVDADVRAALALRPAAFVRVDRGWLDSASCADVETVGRALGVRRPTAKNLRHHLVWLPRAGGAGVPGGPRPRLLAARVPPLRGDPPGGGGRRPRRRRRPPGRPEGVHPGRLERSLLKESRTAHAHTRGPPASAGRPSFVCRNLPVRPGLASRR